MNDLPENGSPDSAPVNGNGNGHAGENQEKPKKYQLGLNPKDKTLERAEFLWKRSIAYSSPTRAVEALIARDGIGESQAWAIWQFAKKSWEKDRIVGRTVGLSILWHQVQDEIVRVLTEIGKKPTKEMRRRKNGEEYEKEIKMSEMERQGWHRLLVSLFSRASEIARACGPDTLEVQITETRIERREVIARVDGIYRELKPEDREVASRVIAALIGPGGEDGSPPPVGEVDALPLEPEAPPGA